MTSVTHSLKRLKHINEMCGGQSPQEVGDKFKSNVNTAGMTAYGAQQAQTAERMRYVRQLIIEHDNLGKRASRAREVELSNRIRKELNELKKDTREAGKLAIQEKKKAEYDTLEMHVKKTEQLYKARYSVGNEGGGGYGSIEPPANYSEKTKRLSALQELEDVNNSNTYSLREDEEFVQFYAQTQANDVEIDKALDRIGAGVLRLQDNAQGIKHELNIHQTLLEETEKKVDNVSSNLKGVNRKLTKTLKEVDKDKFCIYVFCFLILLGMGGLIYFYTSQSSK